MRKILISIVLLVLSENAFSQTAVFLDSNKVLGAFYSEMGSLTTADGKSVSQQFADDTIQHFSGSDGSSIRIVCSAATETAGVLVSSCRIVVKIIYGHHGEPNGLYEEATYSFNAVKNGDSITTNSVRRSISDIQANN